MATLKQFLAELATNPEKLGKFIHDPDREMKAANLKAGDQAALRSGFPGMIYARLAGIKINDAFKLLRPPLFPDILTVHNPTRPVALFGPEVKISSKKKSRPKVKKSRRRVSKKRKA